MLDGKKVEIKTNEGFAPLPADKYTVQIVDVNIKTQLKFQSTEEEEILEYQFQILDDNPIPDDEEATTRGRYVWKRCRLALNSRSHLGKLAAAVIGRTLTKEEAESFDPESIVGKQLDVMVEQNPSKKDPSVIFNNIISFSKVVKKLEPLPIEERKTQVVEKTTKSIVPETAPDAEAEEFASNLEKEGQNVPTQGKLNEAAQAEAEAAELEAAALEARAKAARAKANAAKKK